MAALSVIRSRCVLCGVVRVGKTRRVTVRAGRWAHGPEPMPGVAPPLGRGTKERRPPPASARVLGAIGAGCGRPPSPPVFFFFFFLIFLTTL